MKRMLLTVMLAIMPASMALAQSGLQADSRIKSFVYDENNVYVVTTLYGYQSNIEFDPKEDIQTISLGDRVGWQIIPSGKRLFVRAMADGIRTNMTIITNRRAYQFDLRSVSGEGKDIKDVIYVARFFYPGDQPVAAAAPPLEPQTLTGGATTGGFNFNYTYSGVETLAPSKIFDDGRATYFKASGTNMPLITEVLPGGNERPLSASLQGEYWVVPQTAQRFSLRFGSDIICVYNDNFR